MKFVGKFCRILQYHRHGNSAKHEIKFTKMPSYIWIEFLIKILYWDNFKTNFAFAETQTYQVYTYFCHLVSWCGQCIMC